MVKSGDLKPLKEEGSHAGLQFQRGGVPNGRTDRARQQEQEAAPSLFSMFTQKAEREWEVEQGCKPSESVPGDLLLPTGTSLKGS